jgi:serine/threonine protein phosphatase PrpC
MKAAVKSHVGLIRQINEDCADVVQKDDGVLLAIVADGMGGHQAGDIASKMAVNFIRDSFLETMGKASCQEWELWLKQTIRAANDHIFQYAAQHQQLHGMGTTVVTALCLAEHYIVGHVGDSRVYRYANEQLTIITEDHSLVHELVRSGQITREEAETHPQRNVITRALGTEEDVEVDVKTLIYSDEEYILLCSDGLTNMISETQIIETLRHDVSIELIADQLINLALAAGGDDNVSLALLHHSDMQGEK